MNFKLTILQDVHRYFVERNSEQNFEKAAKFSLLLFSSRFLHKRTDKNVEIRFLNVILVILVNLL